MTSADDVLNQIDAALYDVTVSADAMRSRPVAEPDGVLGVVPTVYIADEAGDWQEIQAAISASFDLEIDPASIDQAAVNPPPTVDRGTIRDLMIRFDAAQARRAQVVLEVLKRAMAQLAAPVGEAADAFRHLPEAVGCNDCDPPAPPRDRPAWQSPYGPARRRR
ncbi:hypothetical protein ACFYNA_15455 [Streptomyces sp. NPDC006640]|uniref:hypothetical protein n=1 Tax=Streptomyces sp. NPDC006640 TaxID=3364754 RepID=UPI0036AE4894